MPTAYQALTGKHLKSVVFRLQKQLEPVGPAAGVLSESGTSDVTLVNGATFAGTVEEIEFSQEYVGEEVTMLGSRHEDEVSGPTRTTITFTEVLKYRNGNFLASVFNNATNHDDVDDDEARIAKVTIQRAGTQFLFYVKLRAYRESYRSGKSVGVLVCAVHDPGQLNNPEISTYTQSVATGGL